MLQEGLAVELIFCDEIIPGTTLLFRVLADYIVLRGFPYVQNHNTNKFMFGVAHCFVTSEDREYALQRLLMLRAHPGA